MPQPLVTSIAERLELPSERLALLEGYSEDDLSVLDDAIALAIRAEDKAVEDGLTEALRFVPRPLRGRARALLFGSDRD